MVDADKPAFLAVLNGLAAVKPGAKLTPEALEVWWRAMRPWSIEDFRAAAAELVRTVEFFPNPFHFEQLRKAASRITAGEAWARVREVARAGGTTSGDPRIDRVARVLGGYRTLGMTSTDQMQFLERRFVEHFEDMGDADDAREALPQLSHDLYNTPARLEHDA